jgi:hypothetical protein
MVASVDQLQYLERDFGERINESVSEPLVRIATDVRARVGLVCARVVDDLRVNPGEHKLEVASIHRREHLANRTREHRSPQSRVARQPRPRCRQPAGKRRKADDDPFIQGAVSPRCGCHRYPYTLYRLRHSFLRHRPRSIPQGWLWAHTSASAESAPFSLNG